MYASAQNPFMEGATIAAPGECRLAHASRRSTETAAGNHMLTLRIAAAISICLSALALSGCETTTAGGAVGANRSQLMLVSSQQLDQMAAQSYARLQSDASRKGTLNQ